MPRVPRQAVTAWAATRDALGLSRVAWAGYLGVTPGTVPHLEAGRRTAPGAWPRLARLLPLVPPPWGTAAPAPPAPPLPLPTVAPVAAPPAAALAPPATLRALRRAHRQAVRTATNLRADLLARHHRARIVACQRAAVALLAAPDPADAHPARTARLVETLRLEINIATGPGSALDEARRAHDTLRLWLLETEAAALAAWLAAAAPPAP